MTISRVVPGQREKRARSTNPLFRASTVLATIPIAITILLAVLAAALPHGPTTQDLTSIGQQPSWTHPLGTDALGRDELARLAYGARTTLLVALWTTLVAGVLGVAVGALAATARRWADTAIVRIIDALYSFPDLLIALLIGSVVTAAADTKAGPLRAVGSLNDVMNGLAGVFVAIALTSWLTTARLVRAKVLSIKGNPYVDAALLSGASRAYLLRRHILPQCTPTVVVAITVAIPNAIVLEAGLSFLGVGVSPPGSSWGLMLADGVTTIQTYPHLLVIPALAIAFLLWCLSAVGQALAQTLGQESQLRKHRGPRVAESAEATPTSGD